MRGSNRTPHEFKHVAHGLIFLMLISDAFEEAYAQPSLIEIDDGSDPEDCYEYGVVTHLLGAASEAGWPGLQSQARHVHHRKDSLRFLRHVQPSSADNSALTDVLPKDYATDSCPG